MKLFDYPLVDKNLVYMNPYTSKPELETLSDGQKRAFAQANDFLAKDSADAFRLSGAAGTGKTYWVNTLMHNLLYRNQSRDLKIGISAPTNEAVGVLKEKCTFRANGIKNNLGFATIHSALGLKPKRDFKTGKTKYVEGGSVPALGYDIWLIDEISMAGTGILDRVMKLAPDCYILMVGDSHQLQPVATVEDTFYIEEALGIPPAFAKSYMKRWSLSAFELTQILRQAEGNPIIKASLQIRNGDYRNFATDLTDEGGMVAMRKGDIDTYIEHYLCGSNAEIDSNFAKLIAYTNKKVSTLNNRVREIRGYEEDFVVGEKIKFTGPYVDYDFASGNSDKQIIYANNEEAVIQAFKQVEYKLPYSGTVVGYELLLSHVKRGTYNVRLLMPEDNEKKELDAKRLAEEKQWQRHYGLKEQFASWQYVYAITAHRCQGRTYKSVMVDVPNMKIIKRFQSPVHFQRGLYTAATRPSDVLYMMLG